MNEIHARHAAELSAGLPSGQPDDESRNAGIAVGSDEPREAIAYQPKPKKKRAPRPTYDDGALTRMFKFPSKKYPKSSYYVTDTEIIIRIRKARKKWKLIVPKKRVVSYRTNRWFAKPRWVEIELTYTQAVRQGLIERTAQPVRRESTDAPDTEVLPVAGDAEDLSTLALASDPAALVEPNSEPNRAPEFEDELEDELDGDVEHETDADIGSDEVTGWVPDDDAELSANEEQSDAPDEDLADDPTDEPVECSTLEDGTSTADTFEADAVADFAPDEPVTVTTPETAFAAPAEISVALFDERTVGPFELPPVVCIEKFDAVEVVAPLVRDETLAPLPRSMCVPPTRRYAHARLLAAALAMVILPMSADWSQMPDSTAQGGPCSSPTPMSCTDEAIVTGSIEVAAVPSAPVAIDRQALLEVPPNKTEPPRATTTAVDIAMEAVEPPQVEPVAIVAESAIEALNQEVVVALQAGDGVSAPSLEHTRAAPPARPAAVDACPVRAAVIAKSTVIQFGFASATLSSPGAEPLDALARTLRQCSAVHVMIEGHTDSDGDYYRNQSLSVRRAEAVRQHLVNAGATPAQLSIIGFGQIRPLAPNDSATNKSKNRRIELVVQ